MKLLIATTNTGKIREFTEMLGSERFDLIGLKDVPPITEINETGRTFRANAVLKAGGYGAASGLWTIADDSGLEVDAIDQKPGVFSARWAAMHSAGKGDVDNNSLLLKQLDGVWAEKRSARFVCVLALASPKGQVMLTTQATMKGRIGFAPVGNNGFGYDPVFQVQGLEKTSAQLAPAEKNRLSHRGKALERMKQLLDRFLAVEGKA